MAPVPRILIVDDDEIISGLIAIMLERKGFGIAGQVMSGEEAIIKSAELEPDLILMDVNLSGFLDGVAAARYIFNLFHVPIIFLTAMCDDKLRERTRSAQPYGFIMKPFTDDELTSTVQLGLSSHSTRKKFPDTFPVGSPRTIMNAIEPVIITDTLGKIIFFNPSALRLLESTEKQVLMGPFRNVVKLINDQTGEPLGDLVRDVVGRMAVVTHEQNTGLVTRSGTRRNVSVTAGPVRDAGNDLMGVSIFIKEKSPYPVPR